jgi:transcription elongation factor
MQDFIDFTIAKQAIKNNIEFDVCQIINNQNELESNFNKTLKSILS